VNFCFHYHARPAARHHGSNEAIEAIAAFSNTTGGTVLLGVSDNGQIIGLNLNAEKLQQWVNEVKTKTTPAILPEAEVITLDGKTVAALREIIINSVVHRDYSGPTGGVVKVFDDKISQ